MLLRALLEGQTAGGDGANQILAGVLMVALSSSTPRPWFRAGCESTDSRSGSTSPRGDHPVNLPSNYPPARLHHANQAGASIW